MRVAEIDPDRRAHAPGGSEPEREFIRVHLEDGECLGGDGALFPEPPGSEPETLGDELVVPSDSDAERVLIETWDV